MNKILPVLLIMAVLFVGGCIESEKTYYLSATCEECWGCGCYIDLEGDASKRIAHTSEGITAKCILEKHEGTAAKDITEIKLSQTELNEIKDCIERLEEEKYCRSRADCCTGMTTEACNHKCTDNSCVKDCEKVENLDQAVKLIRERYDEFDYLTTEDLTSEKWREIEGGWKIQVHWGYCTECYYNFTIYENCTIVKEEPTDSFTWVDDKLKDKLGQEITLNGTARMLKGRYIEIDPENLYCLFIEDTSLMEKFSDSYNKKITIRGIVKKKITDHGECTPLTQKCGKHLEYCIKVDEMAC